MSSEKDQPMVVTGAPSPLSNTSRNALEKMQADRSNANEILDSEEHSAALLAIFENNGWSREEFITQNHTLKTLELFLTDFSPSVPQLQFFPHLTLVRIMHANLTEIKYFENLRSLEVLFLTENTIRAIEGLEKCTKLRELHLAANQIAKIQNLDALQELEFLNLARNEIVDVENLESLTKLKTLWLGGNKIQHLNGGFAALKNLSNLNLAGNNIGSFREIPELNDLPSLATLNFSDPVYGDNPVCSLSNYQTFTLFHVQRITTLDHAAISTDQRSVAEATFVKKKIYYNMRIRTLKRNATLLIQQLNQAAAMKISDFHHSLDVLTRVESELEKEISEAKAYGVTEAMLDATNEKKEGEENKEQSDAAKAVAKKSALARYEGKMTGVQRLISSKHREIAAVEARLLAAEGRMVNAVDSHISRLLAELHTGGNVRLEDGKSKEIWYQSCVELVKTRFFAPDFDVAGIKEMKISKVTRIHNRTLRMQFDRTLESLVDLSDNNYKRALEYLFFAGDLSNDDTLNNFIEHGFPIYSNEHGSYGVPVTNSVFLADQARIAAANKDGSLPSSSTSTSSSPPSDILVGRLVVAKVFLGKCSAERTTTTPASPASGGSSLLTDVLSQSSPPIHREDYAATTASVFRTKYQDPKQRVWFCFEPTLVLPEYIIDFSYTTSNSLIPQAAISEWGQSRADEMLVQYRKALPACSAIDVADCKLFGHHYLQFMAWCKANVPSSTASKEIATVVGSEPHVKIPSLLEEAEDGGDNPPADTIDLYTAKWGFKVNSEEDEESVAKFTYLNLMAQQLTGLGQIFTQHSNFSKVKELVLSHNNLTRIEPVIEHYLPQLTRLDLSHNDIKRLQHLKFKHLQTLQLESNLIFKWDDVVSSLRGNLPSLSNLNMAQNPVMSEPRFKELLLFELPSLSMFNGQNCVKQREELAERPMDMSLPLISAVYNIDRKSVDILDAYFGDAADEPLQEDEVRAKPALARDQLWQGVFTHMSRKPMFEFSPSLCAPGAHSKEIPMEDESQLKKITSMSLAALRISSIRHLHQLRSLVHLQLCSNYITRIEGLHGCTTLETLDLRDNRITSMDGMSSLVNLRKLDLGENFIEKIQGLDALSKLSLLSLDHNQLTSLLPLAQVPSLMEAYLSNNKFDNEKELNALRDMAKLIILDLSHNPCTRAELYRLYAVFQIKRLKVLDGVSIDPQESQLAKDTFAGRISAELLNERVPPNVEWSAARDLNLASCALKELTLLDSFVSLIHLKLEHNTLPNINGIQNCVNLVTLNLSFNKLGNCVVGNITENMQMLESFSLEANQIGSIANLQLRLPRLKFLNLKNNDITKVDGLTHMPQLREILLDKNKLRILDRDAFAHTPLLRELYCEENSIKNIEGVKCLSNLAKFSLASNRLAEIADVERGIEGLPIVDLCLLGNPVIRKSLYRNNMVHILPFLTMLDNKQVTPEERERIETMFQQETIPPNVFTDVRSPVSGGGPIMVAVPQPPAKTSLRMMTLDGLNGDPAMPGVVGSGGGGGGVGPNRVPVQGGGSRHATSMTMGKNVVRTSSADLRGAKPRTGPIRRGGR